MRIIRLGDNSLDYTTISFPDNPFRNLIRLKAISLQSDKITATIFDGFSRMLEMLSLTLEELNINIPGVIGIADKIKKFVNLRKLGLYNGPIDQYFVLQNDTFKPLQDIALQELKIKTRHLIGVDPLAFSHFPNLTTLDMSGTNGLTIADLQPPLLGLKTTDLETLKLSHFTKTENQPKLVILKQTFFENRNFSNLVDMEMDHS